MGPAAKMPEDAATLRLEIGTTEGGERLQVPADLIARGLTCILGASGSGKSYALGVVCEELCKGRVPFVVVDLEGEYWGIKDRYEAIWVGDREMCDVLWSDVDVDRLVRAMPSAPPLILDYSRVDHPSEAVSDLLTSLWRASREQRSPYLIVVEDAERVMPRSGTRAEAALEIAARGRKRGLGLLISTQHPSLVDPDILSQCTLQLIGKLWLDGDLRAAGPFFGREKAEGLAQLERGRFWLLGPGTPGGELVQVRSRETSHKSETPELSINRRAQPSETVLTTLRLDHHAQVRRGPMESLPREGEARAPPAAIPKDRLAVLPFVPIGANDTDSFLADGMTEELIARLAQIRGLRVIARTSAMHYKGTHARVAEIAEELRVGSILEGSVRTSGNHVRVAVQLVDGLTEEPRWSETFDRDLGDLLAVQDEVAHRVVEVLPGRILLAAQAGSTDRERVDPEAYAPFLRARALINQRSEPSLQQALALLQRATTIDPHFARASALMATCHLHRAYISQASIPESIAAAKAAIARAMQLDPDLADAHAAAAEAAWVEDDNVTALKEATRAVELNPSLAAGYMTLAQIKLGLGHPHEGTLLLETAQRLDPLAADPLRLLAMMRVYQGREEEALALWERALPLAPIGVSHSLVLYRLSKGGLSEAERLVRSMELDAPDDVRTWSAKGNLAAARGDAPEAQAIIQKLLDRAPAPSLVADYIGLIRLRLGDRDAFFEGLRSSARGHSLDVPALRYLPLVPAMDEVRRDPRYREVLTLAGVPSDLQE